VILDGPSTAPVKRTQWVRVLVIGIKKENTISMKKENSRARVT
jgi:hypothetical protein